MNSDASYASPGVNKVEEFLDFHSVVVSFYRVDQLIDLIRLDDVSHFFLIFRYGWVKGCGVMKQVEAVFQVLLN